MPQVSKRRIKEKILIRIGDIFLDSILRLEDKKETAAFLSDLLSPTEKLMISKRLAIAVLLAKGYGPDSIKDILKVSDCTIISVKKTLVLAGEGYRKTIKQLLKREKVKKFFLTIEEIWDFLPPKGGDWSSWRRKKWERQMEKQSPF